MAAGIQEIASNLLLQGYLDMNDNPILLGLSDQAYIQTNVSDSSIAVANDSGVITIQALTDIVLSAPETIISDSLVFNTTPVLNNSQDNILVILGDGTVARRSAASIGGGVSVDGVTIDFNTAGELTYIGSTGSTTQVDGITIDYNTAGELTVIEAPVAGRSWTWTGSSNNTVTNSYLNIGQTPSNQAGYVVPFNCTITAISAATNGINTWTAEIRVNGVAQVTLGITAAATGFNGSTSFSVNAGDTIEFYCNGTTISKPVITGWFEEN